MTAFEAETALKSLTYIVDTREQTTPRLLKRMEQLASDGAEVKRGKLDFGDYGCEVTINGSSLRIPVYVERKMDIDEICNCYCQQRKRFTREFERAKESGARICLMIEEATWRRIYQHDYRSKMVPKSLVGSMIVWLYRYDCQLIFVDAAHGGMFIRDFLRMSAREFLNGMVDE